MRLPQYCRLSLQRTYVHIKDYIYYIPASATPIPAGGLFCLERRASAYVCHLHVRFLVAIILLYT
jgi:hypothetical protein